MLATKQILVWFGFVASVLLLSWVRMEPIAQYQTQKGIWASSYSPVMDKAIAGPIPGLMADFRLLDVFAIYYDMKYAYKPIDGQHMAVYLNRAQNLDPYFFDVYRLAGSLLAYDARMPEASIALLQQGITYREDVWEFPFFAGFIAHDLLEDDFLAFQLMRQVVGREGIPLIVLTLASRFLEKSSSKEDAIAFLEGLKQLMPSDYQAGIQKRIDDLRGVLEH